MRGANSRLDLGGVYMVTNRATRSYVESGEVILKADGLTIDPNVLGSDGTVWYNRSIPSPGLLLFLR